LRTRQKAIAQWNRLELLRQRNVWLTRDSTRRDDFAPAIYTA
jgi:hypothetical protein